MDNQGALTHLAQYLQVGLTVADLCAEFSLNKNH